MRGADPAASGGRPLWRSRALYRNDAGSVAFGPGAFAFAAYRRGVFLTDLRGPERLVLRGVGLSPLAFRGDGSFLVADGAQGRIALLSRDGSALGAYRYRSRAGYAYDERAETLFLVTPARMLAALRGESPRPLRPLAGLEGWLGPTGRYL